jgi:NodT family efflux transporter outer membrane factor (OMF) lipoprotein
MGYYSKAPGVRRPTRDKTQQGSWRRLLAVSLSTLALSVGGCTTLREYVHNGFKVGPNYQRPPAPVAEHWIDADDVRVRSEQTDYSHWWTVFNDPVLDDLVANAYQQNLSLREAGFRVLEARAELGIAVGEIFPQKQFMESSYSRRGVSENVANRVATPQRWFSTWDLGFGLAWEVDFWGRFRRAIEAARDDLDVTVENYDDVLVTLIGDVASNYVQIRVLQQRIAYARQTLALQKQGLDIATAKFKGGQTSQVDSNQAQSDVSNTEALIEQQLIQLRQATNRLCILLAIPPEDLLPRLGERDIPLPPPDVVVGIPADLLRRRPDVRRAERRAAAESARIGVADADFYPQISLNTNFGWSSQQIKDLLAGESFRGVISPSFNWPILNYGRILNNVREHDARFQRLVVNYQESVLKAAEEVEDGLVTFIRSHQRTRYQTQAVDAEMAAFKQALDQYKGGLVDFNRVVVIQQRVVDRQQTLADARGQIALGLIQVYRALGGGWEIRCEPRGTMVDATPPAPARMPAPLPAPKPAPMPAPALAPMPSDKPAHSVAKPSAAPATDLIAPAPCSVLTPGDAATDSTARGESVHPAEAHP